MTTAKKKALSDSMNLKGISRPQKKSEAKAAALDAFMNSNGSDAKPVSGTQNRGGRPMQEFAKHRAWRKMAVYVDPANLRALRIMHAETERDMSDLVNDAIAAFLAASKH